MIPKIFKLYCKYLYYLYKLIIETKSSICSLLYRLNNVFDKVTSELYYDPSKKDFNGGLTEEQTIILNRLKEDILTPQSSFRPCSIPIDIHTLFDLAAELESVVDAGGISRMSKRLNGQNEAEFCAVKNGNAHMNWGLIFRIRSAQLPYIPPLCAAPYVKVNGRYAMTSKLYSY